VNLNARKILSEEQLRKWLAKQLQKDPEKDPVMAELWDELKTFGHVEEALKVGTAGKSDLLEMAKALLPHAELMAGVGPTPKREQKKPPELALRLTGYEEKRAKALGEFLAFRASAHTLVQRFREEALGGGLVGPKQARALVHSPAASRFSTDWFKDRSIPIVGHTASFYKHYPVVDENDPDSFVVFEDIAVDPPGELFRTHLPLGVAYEDLPYLRYPNETSKTRSGNHYSAHWSDQEYVHVPVYPGSILDDLRQLSRRLAGDPFPPWEDAQAAQFVLTGEAVPRALTAQYDSNTSEHLTYGKIILTIEPWVPTRTVVQFYNYMQAYMLGRKPRAPSLRNLDVFSFVAEQLRDELHSEAGRGKARERPSWSELMESWNWANPKHRYSSESQFSRDFQRGAHAVTDPYYEEVPDWPPLKLSIP
jgi:hypothetical protein